MTIEEKAQRYDETLEQLKGLIEVTREDKCDIAEEDIIDIFPELKESEDEKIRKTLIRVLNENVGNGIEKYGAKLEDALAWLEKQGDKDKLIKELGEYKVKYTQEVLSRQLEKQGEPTDIDPSEFDLRLNKLLKQFETLPKEELASSLSFYLNVVQNDGTYKADEKKGEQKPAKWSEEDENNLYLTTVAIEREYSGELFLAPKKVNEQVGIGRKLINWLRSFENRVGCEVNCTTTKEWSEEDEKRIKNILSVLGVQVCWNGATGKKGNPYQKEIDWLKSLKPQNHWKPTEAQLASLTIACDRNDRIGFDLTQLLQELKKL